MGGGIVQRGERVAKGFRTAPFHTLVRAHRENRPPPPPEPTPARTEWFPREDWTSLNVIVAIVMVLLGG